MDIQQSPGFWFWYHFSPMRKPLLFLPGPMQVPDEIRIAGDKPLFNHRSPQMFDLLSRLESGCRPLFGTHGDVLLLAASGSGAMESAIVNLTSPGDEVLVAVGGAFAERWTRIAQAFGLTVRLIEADWRVGVSSAQIKAAVAQWPNANVVFLTWSESSTGVLIDLDEIGRSVRSQNKILVVDAVSGLAVSPLQMDDWCVDVVVSGSQKGLMLPPGLGVLAVNSRAWEKNRRSTTPRFYWDWSKYKSAVPFTPATSLFFQLEAALEFIRIHGLANLFARRAEVAERIRQMVRRCGMEVYALKPGNGITGVLPPAGFDSNALIRRLETDFGIQIAEGLGVIQKTTFRIGHVGHVSNEELDYFIQSFETCLN
jgi:serine---pyruvate transaminase